MGAGKGMGFCDLRPGVVFGGLLTTLAHFSDRGRRFGFLLGLMATFVIWTWSRALWARTLMVVARRRGRLVRWCCGVERANDCCPRLVWCCCGGVERASVSRNQQRERLLPPPGRAFNEASRGCPDALHNASGGSSCFFGGLALSALRCVLSGFERRSALNTESGVYGASVESCIRLAEIELESLLI